MKIVGLLMLSILILLVDCTSRPGASTQIMSNEKCLQKRDQERQLGSEVFGHAVVWKRWFEDVSSRSTGLSRGSGDALCSLSPRATWVERGRVPCNFAYVVQIITSKLETIDMASISIFPSQNQCYVTPKCGRIELCTIYNIGFKSSATLKGASVLLLISSTVTPSAISINVNPVAKSTSKTPCKNY